MEYAIIFLPLLGSIIGYLFWDYYTSFGTITFKPSWNGILTNSIKKDLLNSKFIYDLNKTKYEIGKFSYLIDEKILKGEKIFINTKYNQPFSDKYFFKSAVFNLKNQTYIAKDININF